MARSSCALCPLTTSPTGTIGRQQGKTIRHRDVPLSDLKVATPHQRNQHGPRSPDADLSLPDECQSTPSQVALAFVVRCSDSRTRET